MADKNNSPLGGMSDDDLNRIMKAYFNNVPPSNGVNPGFEQQCKLAAQQTALLAWDMYEACIDVGFSNYEAFDLVKVMLSKPTDNNNGKRG